MQPSAASLLKKFWGNVMSQATIKVTQIKSSAHKLKNHKLCLQGLGLRRIGHTVEVLDTPDNRGMINKVYYLVKVEV